MSVQSCVGYQVCFGTRGIVLRKSHDVEIAQDAGSVFHTRGKQKGGVGRKKGYMNSSSWKFLFQPVRYDSYDSNPALCWLTNTKWSSIHLAQPPATS